MQPMAQPKISICPKCNYIESHDLQFACRKCNYSDDMLCRPSIYKTQDGFLIYQVCLRGGWGNINLLDSDKKKFRDE